MNDHTNDWLDDTVRREGDVMFSAHPSAEDLVLFADVDADDGMPAERRHGIEAHLRVCAECDDDLARLAAASLELEQGGRRQRAAHTHDLSSRIKAWFAPSHWIPAVVAVAVTVAILGPKLDEPIVQPVGRAIVLRSDVERGAVPTVTPDTGGRLALSFTLPGTSEGTIDRCEVTILASDGLVVAHIPEAVAFDDYGTFVLTIDARDLTAGSYTLTAQDRIGDRRFSFDLQRFPTDATEK